MFVVLILNMYCDTDEMISNNIQSPSSNTTDDHLRMFSVAACVHFYWDIICNKQKTRQQTYTMSQKRPPFIFLITLSKINQF